MAMEKIEMTCKDGQVLKGNAWVLKEAKANVVLVTGMEEYSARYDGLATYLNEKGYSVYCLDHFGQGENAPTEADLGKWEPSGFRKTVNRLDELVMRLKVTCLPIYLVAHSMGSFISQDYIQRYSQHIDKVVLVGSCGPRIATKFGGFVAKFVVNKKNYNKKAYFFDKLIFGRSNSHIKNHKTPSDWISKNEENVAKYIQDPYCGYVSTYGFYKEFFKGLNRLGKKQFLGKIRKDLPILLLAGQEDPVGLYGKGVKKLEKLYQKYHLPVECVLYPELRHEILNENVPAVYDDLLAFLDK